MRCREVPKRLTRVGVYKKSYMPKMCLSNPQIRDLSYLSAH
jgi:hypothetical protein